MRPGIAALSRSPRSRPAETPRQLTFHVRRGLENGLTREEVTETITHLAFYAGWPKALSALPIATRAMAEADSEALRRDG